jgi:hypothetical protein
MKIGTVFIWENFNELDYEDGEKDVYFLYLGDYIKVPPDEFSRSEDSIILFKLTGQFWLYDEGGERSRKKHLRFKQSEYKQFKRDSILDYEFNEIIIKKYKFDEAISASTAENKIIDILFQLEANLIKNIYNQIKEPICGISIKSKTQIHHCLNMDGYTGLQMPKRKSR